VSAITADESPVLIRDHRLEIDSCHAIWAADGQDCVSWHWALLHRSKRDCTQDSRRQSSNPLKNKGTWGAMRVSSRSPRRDFGRCADRWASQISALNVSVSLGQPAQYIRQFSGTRDVGAVSTRKLNRFNPQLLPHLFAPELWAECPVFAAQDIGGWYVRPAS